LCCTGTHLNTFNVVQFITVAQIRWRAAPLYIAMMRH